jgi:hypothetical protein
MSSDDDIEDSIDAVVDSFFDARELIFEHVGYKEDWRILPIVDNRDDFWAVDDQEREWVKFSSSREALVYWLGEHEDEYGPYGDDLYSNSIYTQRHLSKWVYRGKELTLIVVDTHTDGNQYLQLFCNDDEVRLGDAPEQPGSKPVETPAPKAADHPLNQAIDRMIEDEQKARAVSLLANVRAMCAEVSLADLRAAITAHLAICQQPGCGVLAVMEQTAADKETPT